MKNQKCLFCIILLIIILTMCGCGDKRTDAEKMVGKWSVSAAETTSMNFPDDFQFFTNGVGLAEKENIEWIAENGTLLLTMSDTLFGDKIACTYKIENDKLLLTYNNITIEYKKIIN